MELIGRMLPSRPGLGGKGVGGPRRIPPGSSGHDGAALSYKPGGGDWLNLWLRRRYLLPPSSLVAGLQAQPGAGLLFCLAQPSINTEGENGIGSAPSSV